MSDKRHPNGIRWWGDYEVGNYCTICGRRISHVAFTKRDGTLVDFDYHYGPVVRTPR